MTAALDVTKGTLAAAESELEKLRRARTTQRERCDALIAKIDDLSDHQYQRELANALGGSGKGADRQQELSETHDAYATAEKVADEIERLIENADRDVERAAEAHARALAALARDLEPDAREAALAAWANAAHLHGAWMSLAERGEIRCSGEHARTPVVRALVDNGIDPETFGRLGSHGFNAVAFPADETTLRALARS